MAKEVSAWPMHPYLWRFLIRRIGDQVERVTRLECLEMAITIGEGDAVYRGAEVRGPTIREGGTVPAHEEWNVLITVHRLRVIG